jgi:hypothetical protein
MNIEAIARGLTEAQRDCVGILSREWVAGPTLPDSCLDHLTLLREIGVVGREFGDSGKPTYTASDAGFRCRLSACWWFRLTPLGEQVRDFLNAPQRQGRN